mgnify:FL=1
MSNVTIGSRVYIPVGKQVMRNGAKARQQRPGFITVCATEPARDGKTRVFWKSRGYQASALV